MKEWFIITKEGGAHVWLNGHPHGFNHDISNWGTHFYENGVAVEWLKTEFVTFDNSWTLVSRRKKLKKAATKMANAGTFRSLSELEKNAPPAKNDCKYALHWRHLHRQSFDLIRNRFINRLKYIR
ncbi:hypothetical protein PsorP6_006168 [Peronosclerospora sorghi]|uniref:Uncharacterized protein n=1 Tax=Peronosclerospora sorghi TaxID=230839 RepID=A0ACC0W201_9STRA|nr:hypothetical protein PsorP6_006168 [Peronosclerospora sorghi]